MAQRWWFYPVLAALSSALLVLILLVFAAMLAYPSLPSLDVITDYQPRIPLRVYSAEGVLLGEFGEERRELVKINEVPDLMKKAILSAEDDRFYEHGAVDFLGMLRAAFSDFTSGDTKQGASTITMQVARNFFLSNQKTLTRKFKEVLLALKIEHNLSKDEIFELYINQIYLGQHSYGFAAAARTYFGKNLNRITVAEMAMLAGLPKAPSAYNPMVNPKRARLRQMYVLRRMRELHFIDGPQFEAAERQPIIAMHGNHEFPVNANYLAEMVRQVVYDRYQDDTYTQGIKVYTTIRQKDQAAAYKAVRKGVLDYDRRHGYRGPEGYADLSDSTGDEYLDEALQDVIDSEDLIPAIVLQASPSAVRAYCRGGETIEIGQEGLKFVQRSLSVKAAPNQRIRVGSIIRVKQNANGIWQITQLPQIEAAFVSASPRDGAIYALVGGFDFYGNQFNHITQAWRQPGSSFKPFIYSAALEKGFTPATIIDDAPLQFTADETGNEPWEPKNYEGKFEGLMRMREGLVKSKNLVSIRILQAITPLYAQDYITKFGFDATKQPPYLTMALGAGLVTPMQMLAGYSVFANGGFRITPYFIRRIEDAKGVILYKAKPVVAHENAEQVIDPRNAFTMVSMMQDVIRQGTAIRAMQLGRSDLAGKTGTTSNFVDAWFCGFQPTVVGVSWIGFDAPVTMGDKETGARAALPMWMDYMGTVLEGIPRAGYLMPDNMVAVRINNKGLRDPNGELVEYFYQESQPLEQPTTLPEKSQSEMIKDQLF
ncbi:MAG: penicillin-binding protein 1A [Gallionella sp.]